MSCHVLGEQIHNRVTMISRRKEERDEKQATTGQGYMDLSL